MTRDYAPKPYHRSTGVRWAVWLGAAVLVVLGVLVGVVQHAKQTGTRSELAHAPRRAAPRQSPKFEFYKVLPTMKVQVHAPSQSSSQPPTPTAHTVRVLQLAAFQDEREAERLKAKVAMITGMTLVIHKVQQAGEPVWYRVRSQPYTSEAAALVDKRKLERNRFPVLLLTTQGN